jgi:hypothetical protein
MHSRLCTLALCSLLSIISCGTGESPTGALISYRPDTPNLGPNQPILIEKVPGYPLAHRALEDDRCWAYLWFESSADAIADFEKVQFFYNSEPEDKWSIGKTDFKYVWLYPLFFGPQTARFKIDGKIMNGLELWEKYFDVEAGSFWQQYTSLTKPARLGSA